MGLDCQDRTYRRRLALAGVALLAVLAVTVAIGIVLVVHFAREAKNGGPMHIAYARAIENARRDGIPVTPQLLQAPLPPAEQNAAPVYTQLTQLLHSHPLNTEDAILEDLVSRQTPSDAQFERVRRALKHRSDLMRLIHTATSRQKCVFVRDWSNPVDVPLEEYNPMREAGRLLVAESALMVHDGRSLEAVQNQALAFQIARHLETDNVMIGYMDAESLDSLTFQAFQRILYRAGDKPHVADAVVTAINKAWRLPDLALALTSLAGATSVGLEVLRNQGSGSLTQFVGANASPPIHMSKARWNYFIDENGALLMKLQRETIAAARLPYPRSYSALAAIDVEADQASSPGHMLVDVVRSPAAVIAKRRAELQARADVTRASAALLAYKALHNSFPAKLEQAIRPVPVDPFSGNSLPYRIEGQGFVVYSIGRNGTCTGGSPEVKPGVDDGNVTYHYPLPMYYSGPMKETSRLLSPPVHGK